MSFVERRWKPRQPLTRDQLLGIANYLTYGRIAMVPLIVLLLMGVHQNETGAIHLAWNKFLNWSAMILFAIAQISDGIDGYYARKYNVISSFGKFIDPLADKLLSMSVLVMLVSLQRISAWMVIILISREVTITALRGIAAAEGLEISASNWGKKKTFLQAFAIGALLIHDPFWGINPQSVGITLIWLTLIIAIASGAHYTKTFFDEVIEKRQTSNQEGG